MHFARYGPQRRADGQSPSGVSRYPSAAVSNLKSGCAKCVPGPGHPLVARRRSAGRARAPTFTGASWRAVHGAGRGIPRRRVSPAALMVSHENPRDSGGLGRSLLPFILLSMITLLSVTPSRQRIPPLLCTNCSRWAAAHLQSGCTSTGRSTASALQNQCRTLASGRQRFGNIASREAASLLHSSGRDGVVIGAFPLPRFGGIPAFHSPTVPPLCAASRRA